MTKVLPGDLESASFSCGVLKKQKRYHQKRNQRCIKPQLGSTVEHLDNDKSLVFSLRNLCPLCCFNPRYETWKFKLEMKAED